jgi:alpha-glucuronidase
MKKSFLLSLLMMATALCASAEDGHQLWLRYQPVNKAKVTTPKQTPVINTAQKELETYYQGESVTLKLDTSLPDDDGFSIDIKDGNTTITAYQESGLLYGAYDLLRRQAINPITTLKVHSDPAFALRLLNHWDNPDGSIERGYAGESIFEWFKLDEQLIREYARANASIGINGSVLNNVNASPKMLTTPYLKEVKKIADILRPYNIKVFLSINFGSPVALKETKTADPLDKSVVKWWQKKAKEIYKLIPDFGGFLVKANSEGQPGPGPLGLSVATRTGAVRFHAERQAQVVFRPQADDHLEFRQAEAQCEPPHQQAPRSARLSHRQLHSGERRGHRHLRRQRLDAHGV